MFVADELAAHDFAGAASDPLERHLYTFSVLHCLPVGRDAEQSAATGTVMRPHTLDDYATQAGFRGATVLPIEHPERRFYRLDT